MGGADPFRNAATHYFLPSENEWYKAAYHKNDGVTADYWSYATGSDTAPTAVTSGTTPGTAVYDQPAGQGPAAVDQSGGLSPYGIQGQTGNVYQWMETDYSDPGNGDSSGDRGIRGGIWFNSSTLLQSSSRDSNASGSSGGIGFRVASVPEPSCAVLILSAGVVRLARRRHRAAL